MTTLFLLFLTVSPPQPPPPPPGFSARRPLDPDDYQRKNERGYFTGLPLANYDPSTGAGFGARGYYYWNGLRSDPLFAYTPYLYRVFLQAFFSTGGLQFHWLDFDIPSIAGSNYRFRSQLIYFRNTDDHFFGLGSRAMAPLSFPGSSSYDSFSRYATDRDRVVNGGTFARYDSYDHEEPILIASLERSYLNGLLRPLVGLGFSYHHLTDYSGKTVTVDGQQALMGRTRLAEQCQQNLVVGCAGGWDNFLRFGLAFDTRDFEPDPNRGVFIDASLDIGTKALGSRYQWVRLMISPRVFWSPIPRLADLVLAWRGTFQLQTRSTPFFQMRLIPWTEDPRSGLGGLRTLRGFQQDRFVGQLMTLSNLELRWTFLRFTVLHQKIGLIAVPFLDLGAAYDSLSAFRLNNWKRGQGLALRISWNLATIVTIDYGVGNEGSGLYINFNHMF